MNQPSAVGHYRIISKLGEGGMGAVYRANDPKLNRDVAIKVIPDAFAGNPERMARFAREAQVLASLNHPNIAAIYGIEDRALVMELVEGSTLAERIAGKPLPLEEALAIAQQIADGLAYAHDRGIVHRDLKPANIKITPDDRVKILDFGLAKALSGESPAASDPASSPTLTMESTKAGVIMGTAAYMAPEQARGKSVDKRADIWAFGVVLFEMLTGAAIFAGETVSDTLAAVLRSEIDYARLPKDTPAGVRRLIARCLERDPARRLRDIGDARIVMESGEDSAAVESRRARWPMWIGGMAAGAIAAAAATWYFIPRPSSAPLFFHIDSPKGTQPIAPAVSPDGRAIVFGRTSASQGLNLYLSRLDHPEIKPVPGSDGAIGRAFWSPDSRRIGFFAEGKLKTISIDGGDLQTLSGNLLSARSLNGAWGAGGDIIFSQVTGPINRISETGGAARPVLPLDASRQETAQVVGAFLPDGKHFLYTSLTRQGTAIYEGSLDGSKPVAILASAAVLGYARPAHSDTSYLLVYQDGQIVLKSFDPGGPRISGNTFVVGTDFSGVAEATPNLGAFLAASTLGSISSGTLVLARPFGLDRQFVWVSRDGKTSEAIHDTGRIAEVQISPDQRRVLFQRADSSPDIWLADLDRGTSTRVTFSAGAAGPPLFSRDGARIAYTSDRPEGSTLLIRSSTLGGNPEPVFESQAHLQATSWSPDGQWIACLVGEPGVWDIELVPLERGRKPVPVVATPYDEYQPQFSPDGRWIAYTSNESGRYEMYVTNVPVAAGGRAKFQGKWQVSTSGGQGPRWRADGKELFFLSLDGQMMSVDVTSGDDGFQASAPKMLFPTPLIPIGPTYMYDVTADGRRFLTLPPLDSGAPALSVIVNWEQALAKRESP